MSREMRWLVAASLLLLLACAPARQESTQTPPPARTATEQPPPEDAPSPAAGGTAEPVIGKETPPATAAAGEKDYRGLEPFPDITAPSLTEVTTVRFTTGTGDFTVEVYPQAAPNAARRFLELVRAGFYDNTPVLRVIPGFVAQFGINWRGDYPAWKEPDRWFEDDPSLFRLEPGTLAFAKAGPNTNSTQVFINYRNNDPLRTQVFSVFGQVVEGMEAVESFQAVELDQQQLWENGENYLAGLSGPRPTMILRAEVVE